MIPIEGCLKPHNNVSNSVVPYIHLTVKSIPKFVGLKAAAGSS